MYISDFYIYDLRSGQFFDLPITSQWEKFHFILVCVKTTPSSQNMQNIVLASHLTRALVGSVYNATWWWGGVFLAPHRISETTGRIRKIQTAFESPVKFAEGNPILLTSGSPMTSQVRSKITCFAGHGSSRECAITSSKTHFIENQR